MKKLLIFMLCALTLGSCARQKDEETVRVGVCLPSTAVPYRQVLVGELENTGYYVNLLDGKNDQSYQNRQVAQLVREQYDLLVIEPVIRAATDGLLVGLDEAGIPAVLLNAPEQPARAARQVCRVWFSEEQAGTLQGQCILHTPDRGDRNGDGQVTCAVLAGPEDLVNTSIHRNACLDALADAGISVQLLGQVFGDDTIGRGQALTEGLLDRFGDQMEVLFCGNGQLALGALAALEAAGKTVNEDIYLVSIGGGPELLRRIEAGAMTGAVMKDYDAMAIQVTQAAQALLTGRPAPQLHASYILKKA